jgi:DNA-binding response OmpR family regulator
VVALDTDDLRDGAGVGCGHELIVRPYSEVELGIRIARARQQIAGVESDVLRVGALELNLANYQVAIDGRPINFTYMEYELLKFLATHPGRVFTREALLSRVWGYDYYGGERTVDVHIRRLRAKLGQDYGGRIQTVRSVGYRFDA